MRDLIIVGAGVHAVEMAQIVERLNQRAPEWKLLGLAAPGAALGERFGLPVLGGFEAVERHPQAFVVPDNDFVAHPELPDGRLASLIDPSCFVHPTARIGKGCVLYPHCFVGLNAVLGDRVFVLSGAIVNHDDVIDSGVILCSHVTLAGSVHVESGCYLGQACSVRQNIRIGASSVVGMGAVVIEDVPPRHVVAGNPARKIRENRSPGGRG